ncbi:phospholipase D-like domain-containing protein [Bosea sp. BH3]|uniref:phospholipase D-like domain-containing protein n=1 Tax=Bosea sp. BH3 TaxID=2871701 RepID=UPI0021CB860C|nr:phospholipase D-like domain-containing protein [Bosea sp. BH3]MCU4179100.1 cardiolipin synthase B [Bosea sp. BH3]
MSMKLRRHPLIIGIVSAALGVLGSLVVGNLLPEPQELRQPLPHNLAFSDRQLKTSMGALFGSNYVPGNRVETLVNGAQIFPSMLQAIREAKQTISFETYIYWRGAIAEEFAEALSTKAREGLSVKVLLDWVGSLPMDEGLVQRMKDAGVEVVRFRPLTWYTLDRVNNRTHRKLLVVDGRMGFTGGVGIADEWNGDARSPNEWRDTHYRVEGPAAAEFQAAFAEHWIEATGELLLGDRFFPELSPAGDHAVQVVMSSTHQRNVMHLMLMTALASAQASVRIATPYFVPDELTRQQLLEARKRGVDIQILVPGSQTDARIVRKASRHLWGDLLQAGIRISEYQPTFFHCKLVIVDDIWTSVGSTNIDDRALRLNDEANINLFDRQFAATQAALFDKDAAAARPYTHSDWQNRSANEKFSDWLSSLARSQI